MPDLIDTLCTRCGLCCDGTLFADVELGGCAEATRLAVLGLEIEDDDGHGDLLAQPCAALRGARCSIYVHRPDGCRTFECRLLQDVRRGAVSVESARAQIAGALKLVQRGKSLLARLGKRDSHLPLLPLKERAAEALAGTAGANPQAGPRHAELAATMSALQRAVRRTFLRGLRASGTTRRR